MNGTRRPKSKNNPDTPAAPEDLLVQGPSPRSLRALKWAVAGIILAVYAVSLSPRWLPGDDSSIYLLLGRNLAEGRGYTMFGRPHVTVPPGLPFLIALTTRAGLDGPLVRNAIMLLCALTAVMLAYLVVRRQTTAGLTLLVVLLFALADHVHDIAMQVLSDFPCAVLVILGLWIYVRWSRSGRGVPELGTLALVASIWFRIAVFPIAVGAAVGLLLQRRKPSRLRGGLNSAALVAGIAATLGYFYSYFHSHADQLTPSYTHRIDAILGRGLWGWIAVPLENLAETAVTVSRMLTSQRMPFWAALLLFGVPIIAGMVRHIRRNHVICPLATTAYLGTFIVSQEPKARYLLPIAFLLMLYLADGLKWLLGLRAPLRRFAPHAVAATLVVLTAINLAPDLRRIYWAHSRDFLKVYRHGIKEDLYATAGWMKDNARPDDQFFSSSNRYTLGLLSGLRALPISRGFMATSPSADVVFDLLDREGVTMLVFHRHDYPKGYARIERQAIRRGWIDALYVNDSYTVYGYDRRAAPEKETPEKR